jgi:hypothetical protein
LSSLAGILNHELGQKAFKFGRLEAEELSLKRVCRFSADTSRRSPRLGIPFCRGLMEYH